MDPLHLAKVAVHVLAGVSKHSLTQVEDFFFLIWTKQSLKKNLRIKTERRARKKQNNGNQFHRSGGRQRSDLSDPGVISRLRSRCH